MENRSDFLELENESLTVRAVSELIGRRLRTTYRWIHRNRELPIQRIRRRIFIRRGDIDGLLEKGRENGRKEAMIPAGETPAERPGDSVPPSNAEPVCPQKLERFEPLMQVGERNGQRDLPLPHVATPRIGFLGGFDFMM